MPVEQSILKSTKKMLQIGEDDNSFDLDVITHINSAFSTLHDVGVGPDPGFVIEDDTLTWADFLSDNLVMISQIKQFVWLHVKLKFDPPQAPPLLSASKEQADELLWRINVNRESTAWTDPDPPEVLVEE